MPSEPIEAEFASPAALSREQEEELRQIEHEGPLTRAQSQVTVADLAALEKGFEHDGAKVVKFEVGKAEDPREWSKFRKWCVYPSPSSNLY